MKAHPKAVANLPITNERLADREWDQACVWTVRTGQNDRLLTLTGRRGVGKEFLPREIRAALGPDLGAALDGRRGTRNPGNLAYEHHFLGFITRRRGAHVSALAHFAEALALYWDLGHTLSVAQCYEGMAPSLVAVGRPACAARLLAAAESIRRKLAAPLAPLEATAVASATAAARAALGDAAYAAAWEAGREPSAARTVAETLALTVPVDSVAAGESVSAEKGEPVMAEPTTEPVFDLTRREREILALLVRRLTDPEIAQTLYIGTRTVERHVAHILRKLNAANRREAAAIAMWHALV